MSQLFNSPNKHRVSPLTQSPHIPAQSSLHWDDTYLQSSISPPAQRSLLDQLQEYYQPAPVTLYRYLLDNSLEAVTLSDYIAVKYDWEMHDERRCELIEKDISENSLTTTETSELEHLQELADLWLSIHNPQPIATLDAMITQLKSEGKWLDSI